MLIDAHVHLPYTDPLDTLRAKNKLLNDLDSSGVDYAILIPDSLQVSGIGNLDQCLSLTKDTPRLFLMGTLDILRDKRPLFSKLDRLFSEDKICAIKIFPGHDPYYPTDKRLEPAYELCLKYNRPLVIHTGWNTDHPEVARFNDPKHIVKVADKFPKLRIVIAHYFWPEVDYCFKKTINYDNIYFDTSGLADNEVVEETGYDNILKVLQDTLKRNPSRVIFGTDYTMCTIDSHKKLVKNLKVGSEVERKVYYQNAINVYGLKV